jgi:MFS family permease
MSFIKNLSREQKTILIVLSLVNFFNYVDRQVIFPLFDHIKREFLVSDFQLGLLGTVFMLVHSLASVPLGLLADKSARKNIIAVGVFFWSIATFASGIAASFKQLLGIRSLVGIGEAAYAPAATAMISDNLPEESRAQAQGVFNAGMFIGGTIGAMLGGVVAFYFNNWRLAFFLVSIPGIILAYLSSKLKDIRVLHNKEQINPMSLLKNRPFIWVIISGTLTTFATGAFISWGIEFVMRYKGYNLKDASLILGATMMLAGVLGVVVGSYLADHFQERFSAGRSLVIAASLMTAAPFMYLGVHGTGNSHWFLIFLFLGTVFLSFYHGPSTAVIHDVVPQNLRATAFAVYLLVIHLLGDTLAPAVVGKVSDIYNLKIALEWSTFLVFLSGVCFLAVVKILGDLPKKEFKEQSMV